jgi:exosome complex component RRP46
MAAVSTSTSTSSDSGVASSTTTLSGGYRPDRRSELQIRAPDLRAGLLVRADGSVRYSQGHTQLIIAVHGPIPVGRKDEKIERATLEVIMKPSYGRNDQHIDVHRAEMIRLSLESMALLHHHPCTKIEVVIQVIRDDGSLLATALNGCCLALLDAGVQCNSIISAVTMAAFYVDTPALSSTTKALPSTSSSSSNTSKVRFVLDPVLIEEQGADAMFTFAFSNTDATSSPSPPSLTLAPSTTPSTAPTSTSTAVVSPSSLIVSDTRGIMTDDIYFQSLELARRTCATVEAFFRSALEKSYTATPTE